jgi:hypothetical protein
VTRPLQARPFSFALRLKELEHVSSVFVDWQGRIEQVSSGRFEGKLQVVSGALIRIIDIEGNPKVRVRGHDSLGLVSVYPVTPEFATGLWQRRRLDPGRARRIDLKPRVPWGTCGFTSRLGHDSIARRSG